MARGDVYTPPASSCALSGRQRTATCTLVCRGPSDAAIWPERLPAEPLRAGVDARLCPLLSLRASAPCGLPLCGIGFSYDCLEQNFGSAASDPAYIADCLSIFACPREYARYEFRETY